MPSALLAIALLLWCAHASAEQTGASARERFEAGLAAVGRGELELGLREFEAAYAIAPRYPVLFNIGQAQTSLGRPVEAIATFQRFLAEGGQQISDARRLEVRRLIELNRKSTGILALKLESPGETRVWVDGRLRTAEELTAPLSLPVGEHTLLYSHGSGFPTEQKLRIESERTTEVVIPAPPSVPPAEPVASAASGDGSVAIGCAARGIRVEVAGRPVGSTPLAQPIRVSPGSVRLRFLRDGFEPVARDVSVSPGIAARLGCTVPLVPTRASIERERAASRKRVLGWSLAGAGLASLGASAALFQWNEGRYDDWTTQRTAENPMVDRAVSIQRADDAAAGLLVLGAGLGAAAAWSLITAD